MKETQPMRLALRGFVAFSLVGAAFVGGFSGPNLIRGLGQPERAFAEARSGPAQLLGRIERLTRPAPAQAGNLADLSPAETFASVQATIRRDFASPPTEKKSATEWSSRLKYAAIKGMVVDIPGHEHADTRCMLSRFAGCARGGDIVLGEVDR